MNTTEINKRIEEINDWHYGTVHKQYDRDEEAEVIAEDNTRMVKALLSDVVRELILDPGMHVMPNEVADNRAEGFIYAIDQIEAKAREMGLL